MADVTPNEPEDLSQNDIDAALSAAAAGTEPATVGLPEPASPTAEVPEMTAGDAVEPSAMEAAEADAVAEETLPAEASAEAESSAEFAGLSQDDIDAALAGASQPAPAKSAEVAPAKLDSAGRPFDEMAAMMEAAIAEERAAAQAASVSSASAPTPSSGDAAGPVTLPPPPPGAIPLELPGFSGATASSEQGIELLSDVELNVKIELGRAEMLIEDVLRLGDGSVVELDKLAGDPVDVLVNDRLVARGEVIVLNENFCVRVSEIVAGDSEEENN